MYNATPAPSTTGTVIRTFVIRNSGVVIPLKENVIFRDLALVCNLRIMVCLDI
jgi:hypothetical protein